MSRSEELYAGDLADEHVGRDVVFTVEGLPVGGTLTAVERSPVVGHSVLRFDDGAEFALPAGKPVTVTELSGRVLRRVLA